MHVLASSQGSVSSSQASSVSQSRSFATLTGAPTHPPDIKPPPSSAATLYPGFSLHLVEIKQPWIWYHINDMVPPSPATPNPNPASIPVYSQNLPSRLVWWKFAKLVQIFVFLPFHFGEGEICSIYICHTNGKWEQTQIISVCYFCLSSAFLLLFFSLSLFRLFRFGFHLE